MATSWSCRMTAFWCRMTASLSWCRRAGRVLMSYGNQLKLMSHDSVLMYFCPVLAVNVNVKRFNKARRGWTAGVTTTILETTDSYVRESLLLPPFTRASSNRFALTFRALGINHFAAWCRMAASWSCITTLGCMITSLSWCHMTALWCRSYRSTQCLPTCYIPTCSW